MHRDRTIANNKPDIIIRDNEKGTCVLIDAAISGDRNVINEEAEEVLKYRDLEIEIQRVWNLKSKVILVNNRGDWNHLKITPTVPEQQAGKARN